jgi:hypothetical protein
MPNGWKASPEQRRAWAKKYDGRHRRRRAIAAVKVVKGEAVCWRCGKPIVPGEPWELGHDDEGTEHRGPEHRYCNRSAAGKRTRERLRRRTSLEL